MSLVVLNGSLTSIPYRIQDLKAASTSLERLKISLMVLWHGETSKHRLPNLAESTSRQATLRIQLPGRHLEIGIGRTLSNIRKTGNPLMG